jgi:hypothetical protein
MGNCVSNSDVEKDKKKTNEDPELMGKAKFLSCPAMSEVTDATQTKWLIIVFAPLTHHGLIFAARNVKDGTLLAKDILDKQVAKEKEEQKVQLSYNLFFKAISTEVAKAGRSGAKVEWLADGSMSVECKIAISGSASSNKKPDTYTAVLKKIDSSEENLFKYIAEPLATHYCKKRTDGWNLDRPDPHKEKLCGEQEANAIMRAASMRASQKILDQELPSIVPLRQDHATARAERDAAVAKVNLMKQMLLTRGVDPPLLKLPPEDAFAACELNLGGLNAMAAALEPHLAFPAAKDLASRSSASDDPPAEAGVELGDLRSPDFTAPADLPMYRVGLAVFRALDLVGDGEGRVAEDPLRRFLYRMDTLHRPMNAFHNGVRSAERLQGMFLLVEAARSSGFRPETSTLLTAMMAAVMHDVDHCGLNNQQGARSINTSYLPTLYNYESQVERHSLAVGMCEAFNVGVELDMDGVAVIVLATDLSKHHDFMARLTRRVREVADFSRRYDDQLLGFAALLKAADLCHLYKAKQLADAAVRDMAVEQRRGNEANSFSDSALPEVALFVNHVAKPLFLCIEAAFPATHFATEGCARNFS